MFLTGGRKGEVLYEAVVMLATVSSPIWGWAGLSAFLHRRQLSPLEIIAATIPALFMLAVLTAAYTVLGSYAT